MLWQVGLGLGTMAYPLEKRALSGRLELPCARITSIRFKGTFSVASLAADNTPSECTLASAVWILMQYRGHQSKIGVSTPSTLCSFGLVVVYCRWILPFSGKMMGAAAKAASAHSWKPERISFFLPG